MDRTAAQSLASNPQISAKNKHIDFKIHHVRELIDLQVVFMSHVQSKNQPADLRTKIMSSQTLKKMVQLLHLHLLCFLCLYSQLLFPLDQVWHVSIYVRDAY